MEIISINIGQKQTLQNGSHLETTGIFKVPTSEPVQVNLLGLQDDFIFSSKHHGGPDQAVYVYGGIDYSWWAEELGRELVPGTFGENLTISEMESASFSIGDRMQIGSVILEVTSPRIPCSTLAARMADMLFVKRFRQAERPGIYCRIIQTGVLQIGENVTISKYQDESLSILEVFRAYYEKDKSEALIQRHLKAPIAIRNRMEMEQELVRRREKI